MRKTILTTILAIIFVSCADQSKRQKFLEKEYPNSKVEPSTGLVQREGYEFIIIDSTNQIIAVSFYPFFENKISSMRNIR